MYSLTWFKGCSHVFYSIVIVPCRIGVKTKFHNMSGMFHHEVSDELICLHIDQLSFKECTYQHPSVVNWILKWHLWSNCHYVWIFWALFIFLHSSMAICNPWAASDEKRFIATWNDLFFPICLLYAKIGQTFWCSFVILHLTRSLELLAHPDYSLHTLLMFQGSENFKTPKDMGLGNLQGVDDTKHLLAEGILNWTLFVPPLATGVSGTARSSSLANTIFE